MDELKELSTKGFIHIDNLFPDKFLNKLMNENHSNWADFTVSKKFAKYNGMLNKRTKFRGSTVSFKGKGRYDLALDFGVFEKKRFIENERIMEIINPLFKDGYTCFAGSLPSTAGSVDGRWHRDTWPLFGDPKLEGKLPIYYVTALIPLVDLNDDRSLGSTELIVGSHRGNDHGQSVLTHGEAGSCTLLDGRLRHRGLANRHSHRTRHMLYIVYCKKWYYEYPEPSME